ncbi:MAG: hypothetical protein E4H01_00075 [Lysobacterales bacterium]|nr:MAG: hypothetical protein E4H01_00075 [Xanthomonadales bacterium]
MSVGNPQLSGVSPVHEETSVVLKPIIQLVFTGPSLIDPLTWNSGTFALYGPGDVVIESGPGTILNQDIQTDPYTLIDGAVFRERIDGTYRVYTSGLPPTSGIVTSGALGTAGSVIIAEFIPAVPLNAYTEYTAVLVGEEALSWSTSSMIFPGVTSWTSDAAFSGTTATSGIVTVLTPYTRTLPTILHDSGTGYNDTYTLIVSSGSTIGAPKFTWEQTSDGAIYPSEGQGPHDLGEGLTFEFSGIFVSGEQYDLNVYIPKPLEDNFVWTFTTSNISGSTPPTEPDSPSLIIDLTPDGGMAPVSESSVPLQLVNTWPDDLAYGVRTDLPLIMLEFNKELVSGSLDINKLQIRCTALLNMPNSSSTGLISPQTVEYSGVFLKLWL